MKPQVFCNLLIDNAALIIATIGITFVLLIGGIDISIGSVVALTCMSSAQMLQNTGLPAPAVILIVLAMGAVFGLVQGWLITEFNMQPFIVTLAGQFFARGMTGRRLLLTIPCTPRWRPHGSMSCPADSSPWAW